MKKICFVLTVSTGINYGSIFTGPSVRNNDELKNFFLNFMMFRLTILIIKTL